MAEQEHRLRWRQRAVSVKANEVDSETVISHRVYEELSAEYDSTVQEFAEAVEGAGGC